MFNSLASYLHISVYTAEHKLSFDNIKFWKQFANLLPQTALLHSLLSRSKLFLHFYLMFYGNVNSYLNTRYQYSRRFAKNIDFKSTFYISGLCKLYEVQPSRFLFSRMAAWSQNSVLITCTCIVEQKECAVCCWHWIEHATIKIE